MIQSPRAVLLLGCLFAASGVILGAFGAHMLKSRLSEYALGVFEVGVRYQMYHALALVLLGVYLDRASVSFYLPAYFFVAGIFIFSGSLYLLAWTGVKALGAITPLGGLCLILGWLIWIKKIAF